MYERREESQPAMKISIFSLPSSRRETCAAALVCALLLAVGGARAQEQGGVQGGAQTNPLRAVTDFMKITTETPQAPDFVRATRPDAETMDYSHLTGVDKKRAPVKTPEQVQADTKDLMATRARVDGRRKKLEGEKIAPVAPNKAPAVADE
jgi:hypothetical protein